MTKLDTVHYLLKKTMSDDYLKITDEDILYAIDKAKYIIDSYVNFTTDDSFNHIICDMACDILLYDVYPEFQHYLLPSKITSLKEGDSTVRFGGDSGSSTSVAGQSARNYLQLYKDHLNRFRKLKF